MLESVDDPDGWGPAKVFTLAALDAGVDLTDRHQVKRVVEQYNGGLAA